MDATDREATRGQGEAPSSRSGQRMGRRRLLKGTTAVVGGATLAAYTPPGLFAYARPTLRSLRVPVALAVSGIPVSGIPAAVQGSPGFWKDNGKGQVPLWDSINDLDWKAWAQKLGLTAATPANPYVKTDPFTSVFAPHPAVAGLTMEQLIDGVKDKNSTELQDAARKAARALVASYLDASLYGPAYTYTQAQLKALWQQAVTTNTKAAFDALETQLEATYN